MQLFIFVLSLMSCTLFATDPKPTPQSHVQEVDVQKLKKDYWSRGKEGEVGLVQDRLYSKRHKFELGAMASALSGDPFLSMYAFGGTLGYHFSEYISVHVFGWKTSVKSSSALDTLQTQTGATANTNEPNYILGTEGRASLLYGKLSLIGSAIIYFDSYFSLGGGIINTESGSNLLGAAGIGQQIHISQTVSINLDFKLLYYHEKILGKGLVNRGQDLGPHWNLSNMVSLGVSLFL